MNEADVNRYEVKLRQIETKENPRQELAQLINKMQPPEREEFLRVIVGWQSAPNYKNRQFSADGSDQTFNQIASDLEFK